MLTRSRQLRIAAAALIGLVAMAHNAHRRLVLAQSTEGNRWLDMNSDTRSGFVWGYILGVTRGFAEGCEAYDKIVPLRAPVSLKEYPFAKCLNSKGRGFSKPIPFYQEEITDFYSSFPSDRDVPFGEVLKRLSDDEHMTPAQIHEWFKTNSHLATLDPPG